MLRIYEYDTAKLVELTLEEVLSIQDYSSSLKKRLGLNVEPLVISPTRSGYTLKAQGFAGFFSLGRIQIEVVPKFLRKKPPPYSESASPTDWKEAFFAILSRLGRSLEFKMGSSAGWGGSLPDITGRILLESLELAEKLGDARKYRTAQDDLRAVRGGLDPTRYWRRAFRPELIPSRYQDYSRDNPTNQLLKWAAKKLSVEVFDQGIATRLRFQIERLAEVADRQPPFEEHSLVLASQFRHLDSGVQVAKMLADHQLSTLTGDHTRPNFELVWNTARVFEDFTFEVMREASMGLGGYAFKQSFKLASGVPSNTNDDRDSGAVRNFSTTPDIVVKIGEQVGVWDCKYKILGNSPNNADVYQVITDAKLLKASRCGLIYPAETRDLPAREYCWDLHLPGEPLFLETLCYDIGGMAEQNGFERLRDSFMEFLLKATNCDEQRTSAP